MIDNPSNWRAIIGRHFCHNHLHTLHLLWVNTMHHLCGVLWFHLRAPPIHSRGHRFHWFVASSGQESIKLMFGVQIITSQCQKIIAFSRSECKSYTTANWQVEKHRVLSTTKFTVQTRRTCSTWTWNVERVLNSEVLDAMNKKMLLICFILQSIPFLISISSSSVREKRVVVRIATRFETMQGEAHGYPWNRPYMLIP